MDNSLIKLQAAIDEIDEWIKAFLENGHKESAADACLIQDGIIQLPSTQQWIPCSEGLPKKDGRYQVTRYDYVTKTEFIDILWYEKGLWWDRRCTGDYAVIAWKPLPKPYKKEGKKK